MPYYARYKSGKTDDIIAKAQAEIYQAGNVAESYFLELAARISLQNIQASEGGPFAAVIIKEGTSDIIGIGANHVLPEYDPSAHGEICAIRDATARLGYSDLSGMVMFSSCECCPQCQAAVTGVGIKRVVYANDRFQAAEIGFSDEEQYRLMHAFFAGMTQLESPAILNGHGAVVLDGKGGVIAYGDADVESHDPLASLPSVNAIRAAAKAVRNVHLDEDTVLVTKDIIHPAAFTTADWARIGRVRDEEYPDDPAKDQFTKNPAKLRYVHKQFEEIRVKDKDGRVFIPAKSEEILYDLQQNAADRMLVKTERTEDKTALKATKAVFDAWQMLVGADSGLRY